MAHYALIDENNIVVKVITGVDESELIEGLDTETWYSNLFGLTCKRTSYNGTIRKRYAGVGFTYDPQNDVFIVPQPYPSWELDENFDWQAPIPMPLDGAYEWIEIEQIWQKLPEMMSDYQ